jgi:hypothetical protein
VTNLRLIAAAALFCSHLPGQAATRARASTEAAIQKLLPQLHWDSEQTHAEYNSKRDRITLQVWKSLDRLASLIYSPARRNTHELERAIDRVLGYRVGLLADTMITTGMNVDLPSGEFVILALEIWRGGGALCENAASFRAYRVADGRLALADHVELKTENQFLCCVRAKPLPGLFPDRFGFIGWADEPPRSPYTVAVRVYVFDGEKIQTVWAPREVITGNDLSFVKVTHTGFQLLVRAPDRWTDTRRTYAVLSDKVVKTH